MGRIWQHCPTGPPARPGAVPSSSAQRPGGRRRHRGGRSRADGVLLLQVQEGGAGKPPARRTADKMMNREQVVISFRSILNFGNKRNIRSRSHGINS